MRYEHYDGLEMIKFGSYAKKMDRFGFNDSPGLLLPYYLNLEEFVQFIKLNSQTEPKLFKVGS